jgi:D-glycero-D-manno-heptose 1,7-bisphosphate phosphatase
MKPAVFLDRDGTLLEEAGYLDRLERLAFFPFGIDAVRLLNRGGYAVVIITNQSGVGRGMYEEAGTPGRGRTGQGGRWPD